MKPKIFIVALVLLLIFDFALVTRVFYPYIVIFNLLVIFTSSLSIEPLSKYLFSRFNYLKKNKRTLLLISNTALVCSSVLLLFLTSIDVIRNENALNKIRSFEIKTEITVPTEGRIAGQNAQVMGIRSLLFLTSDNGQLYTFISDQPIIRSQVATSTQEIYITHRPSRIEDIYGKQISSLEEINKIRFNFNQLVEPGELESNDNSVIMKTKFTFFLNGLLVGTYIQNNRVKKLDEGLFGADLSKIFNNIGKIYDDLQKSN